MASAPTDPVSADEPGDQGRAPRQTQRQAMRPEFRRITHPPFETLLTVAINAALMSSAWFFLPPSLRDQLFELHGSLAFAFVLSSWMYSDVPATNVLACGHGPDPGGHRRARGAPPDPDRPAPDALVRSWRRYACSSRSSTASGAPDRVVVVYSAVAIGVIPLGVLGVSAWVGVLFPYHPIPIRYRWEHRREWWPMLGGGDARPPPLRRRAGAHRAVPGTHPPDLGAHVDEGPDHEGARQRPRPRDRPRLRHRHRRRTRRHNGSPSG